MEPIYNDFIKTYDLLKNQLSWNYIDVLNISVQSLEDFFRTINLDVLRKPKIDYVEDYLNPPSIVCYFYYFLYLYNRIPNQQEYINFYYITNSNWIKKHVGTQYDEAFKGRLSRFYPSMLRDIHFYHLLKESMLFNKVLYVLQYDLDSKIDIFVKTRVKWYGLQLRTKTVRSEKYYNKKYHRNMIPTKATLIDIPINLDLAKSILTKGNDLKVYSNNHLNKVLEIIYIHEK
jgi:hypothetical protein